MEREIALERAVRIAQLVLLGTCALSRVPFGESPLQARDSLKHGMMKGEVPQIVIDDIILFGSTARCGDKAEVGDIDLMVIDRGFYSPYFGHTGELADEYSLLSKNLERLVQDWFLLSPRQVSQFIGLPLRQVDLHILPSKLFTSPLKRRQIALRHRDSEFLQNAFAHIMRYDPELEAFVDIDIEYFEQKYGVDLNDLRFPMAAWSDTDELMDYYAALSDF